LGTTATGACRVDEHAKRLPGVTSGKEKLKDGVLLVTLLVNGGDDDTADPILLVPAEMSEWFVRTWLKLPESWLENPPALARYTAA
jgi:hypothetical protein